MNCRRISYAIESIDEEPENDVIRFSAVARGDDDKWIGEVSVEYLLRDSKRVGAKVERSHVLPQLRRCGIGTKLYELAAQYLCSEGIRLKSDIDRSPPAESFWRKQLRKKRAACIKPSPLDGRCHYYQIKSCPVRSLKGVKF